MTKAQFKQSVLVHNAMRHAEIALCECATANHYSESQHIIHTDAGVRWLVFFKKLLPEKKKRLRPEHGV